MLFLAPAYRVTDPYFSKALPIKQQKNLVSPYGISHKIKRMMVLTIPAGADSSYPRKPATLSHFEEHYVIVCFFILTWSSIPYK